MGKMYKKSIFIKHNIQTLTDVTYICVLLSQTMINLVTTLYIKT